MRLVERFVRRLPVSRPAELLDVAWAPSGSAIEEDDDPPAAGATALDRVLRCRGTLWITPRVRFELSHSGGHVRLVEGEAWAAADERASQITCIGPGLDTNALHAELSGCLLDDREWAEYQERGGTSSTK